MFRRILSTSLILSLLIVAFCGCSKKLKLEDVAENPRARAEQAAGKMSEKYRAVNSPLEKALSTAEKGAFEIKFATQTGEKVVVTATQNLATGNSLTTWKNTATGSGWSAAVHSGMAFIQPDLAGDWYGLALNNFDENVKSSQLSEVLNQSDQVIINKIRNKYRNISADNPTGEMLDFLLEATKDAEVTTEAGWAEIGGKMEDAIIVNFSMTPEMMSDLIVDIITRLECEQYGHTAYLQNLVRECLRQAGCEFYREDAADTLADRLQLAGMQIQKFYKETDSQTNLRLAINPKTGTLVNIAFVVQDSVSRDTVSLIFNFVFDDNHDEGYSGSIKIIMSGQGSIYTDFDICIEFDTSDDGKKYSQTKLITYTSDLIKWRVSDVFVYDRNKTSYNWQKTYDNQDLTLEGHISTEDGFSMSIDTVQFSSLPAKQVSLKIEGKEYSEDSLTNSLDICSLTKKQTEFFIQSITENLPVIVFGNWEPWQKIDISIFEKFREGYDYDQNGKVDEKDRAYFDHVSSILNGVT